MNNVRTNPAFIQKVDMTSGQSTTRQLVYYFGAPGPGSCRISYYTVTCNADGSVSSVPDNTMGEPAGCPFCAANTLNDCF